MKKLLALLVSFWAGGATNMGLFLHCTTHQLDLYNTAIWPWHAACYVWYLLTY